ncbi:MAG: alpha-hydroxy-acid oxidizing protein [Chloroflexi bacterium]|nr:alpha-hydroxy-acid oxidizing protein [Chloroflexota bacterium]
MAEQLTVSQLYSKGQAELEKLGYKRAWPPDSTPGTSAITNRVYLDSLFFVPRFLEAVESDTTVTVLGQTLQSPVFCSPMSAWSQISDSILEDCARGLKKAGSLMMLGIGGSDELQRAIDTGVPVVKIVKPYRDTDLIFQKLQDAERRGCVAVGMDIDHFYGRLAGEAVGLTETFAPQSNETLRQAIGTTKLPFVIKGVLGTDDALKAVELGASALIVSNHGRASVDCTLPSAVALPEIVDTVGQQVEIYVDTGFKTGNDIVKALALGARAVGFASSILLAWGAAGEEGVTNLVLQLSAELRRTMSALGCANCAAVEEAELQELPRSMGG